MYVCMYVGRLEPHDRLCCLDRHWACHTQIEIERETAILLAQTLRPHIVDVLNPWLGITNMGKIRASVSTRWRKLRRPRNKCNITKNWKVIRCGAKQSSKQHQTHLLKVQIFEKAGRTFVILNRKRTAWSWILFGVSEKKARASFWRSSFFTAWWQCLAKVYQDRDQDDEYLTISVRESHDPHHAFNTLVYHNVLSFENTAENWAWLVHSARKTVRIKDAMRVAISVSRISVAS
jgi:hypothetical protein